MAKYRVVYTQFWDDPRVVEEMTPEDKYVFHYLLTNKNTKQIGIYTITKKQMAFDTGYSQETIQSILERLINKHQLVKYNLDTREIRLKIGGNSILFASGKPVEDCMKK
ncbi:replication protein [Bacillus sp. FJAT-49705]|uniref:Replication protein n=1 Tax=Cytobacillus citreus TaxID=2833586 RepID=A0ABS5NPZ4_9BACI|nr:replication protein [Cytobacillus citreus]MBS4189875.1 replication protein [Cytobacillus citreus]